MNWTMWAKLRNIFRSTLGLLFGFRKFDYGDVVDVDVQLEIEATESNPTLGDILNVDIIASPFYPEPLKIMKLSLVDAGGSWFNDGEITSCSLCGRFCIKEINNLCAMALETVEKLRAYLDSEDSLAGSGFYDAKKEEPEIYEKVSVPPSGILDLNEQIRKTLMTGNRQFFLKAQVGVPLREAIMCGTIKFYETCSSTNKECHHPELKQCDDCAVEWSAILGRSLQGSIHDGSFAEDHGDMEIWDDNYPGGEWRLDMRGRVVELLFFRDLVHNLLINFSPKAPCTDKPLPGVSRFDELRFVEGAVMGHRFQDWNEFGSEGMDVPEIPPLEQMMINLKHIPASGRCISKPSGEQSDHLPSGDIPVGSEDISGRSGVVDKLGGCC